MTIILTRTAIDSLRAFKGVEEVLYVNINVIMLYAQ